MHRSFDGVQQRATCERLGQIGRGTAQAGFVAQRRRVVRRDENDGNLGVLAANQRAIGFYEQVGFAVRAGSERVVEIGGEKLPEVRFEMAIS